MISISTFANEYHGHPVEDLSRLVQAIRQNRRIIWLAGDSSLDNKVWITKRGEPINGYEKVLSPGTLPVDVSYHLNKIIVEKGQSNEFVCINCAVEESTLASRKDRLLPHDRIIQENIKQGDVLIVSVGGNDIALAPSISTVAALLAITTLASDDAIISGHAIGMGHLLHMFGRSTQDYIEKIVSKNDNGGVQILPCMIYYPALKIVSSTSWADTALYSLGYDSNPKRLQLLIRSAYEHATTKIQIPNNIMLACPLFKILDPTNTTDYEARVEPSAEGGLKMAKALYELFSQT
jgi:hypothetical protein